MSEQQLPDLDEYSGATIRDIAFAVVHWSDAGDEEAAGQAVEALRRRAPGIGHNRPPLAERLEVDFAPLIQTRDKLLEVYGTVKVANDEDAAKAQDLARQMRAFEEDVGDRLKVLRQPYDDALALITGMARLVGMPVHEARVGDDPKVPGGLRKLLTDYDDERRAAVAAEQAKAREEQQRLEREAAEAQRKVDEAAAAGKPASPIAGIVAQDKARQAERQADRVEAMRPPPIRGQLGQMTRRRVPLHEIEDLRKVIADWILPDQGRTGELRTAVETMIGQYLRSLKIEAVARGVTIPGARVWVGLGSANVRS